MNDLPFTPAKIRNLEIRNRFIMSAAVDGMANNLDMRIRRYSELAEGGVGLIIAGRILNKNESFEKVVDAVHKVGGKIALQILSHKGLAFEPNRGDRPAASVVSKDSVIFSRYFPYTAHHEATEKEVEGIIADHVIAAEIAKDFGVDAIEVHSAHDSALMQFLSPLINQRKDKWGGPVQNRIRIHKEVYKAVRAAVGEEIPIFIKLGVKDPYPGGLTFNDGKIAAELLAECGYDALEISQGLQDFSDSKSLIGTPIRMMINDISKEAYFRDWCREIKKTINKPTIMTGGIRSYELAEDILKKGETDFIGMCRPFIKEPGLIKRWRNGDRKKSTCISCNKCGFSAIRSLPLACYMKEKLNFKF